MSQWEAVIGLEVHARLLTQSKIFCGCPTAFGAAPNTHVCPVCLGYPGALPVLNRNVVELAMRAALATGCTVHERSIFARKNYFYPDLPKGYQISQFDQPLATGGRIGNVRLIRIHMEEDAGKLIHHGDVSLVDLNRAGVPLIEIVSEPDIRSAAEADAYLTRLRQILMYAGICDGNMEEGSLRCDANVSVRRPGEPLGTRAEIKNLNSFRFLRNAIEFEIERQTAILEKGGTVSQETRLFDVPSGETRLMRSKEEAHDYRYFPEPDLFTLRVDRAWIDEVRAQLPGDAARARALRKARHRSCRRRGFGRDARAIRLLRRRSKRLESEGGGQLGAQRGAAVCYDQKIGCLFACAGDAREADHDDREGRDREQSRQGSLRRNDVDRRGARCHRRASWPLADRRSHTHSRRRSPRDRRPSCAGRAVSRRQGAGLRISRRSADERDAGKAKAELANEILKEMLGS